MKISQKKRDEMLDKPYIQEFISALKEEIRAKRAKISEATLWDYCYEIDMFYKQTGLNPNEKPTFEQAEQWREGMIDRYARKTASKKIPPINHYLKLCCSYLNTLSQVPNISRAKIPVRLSREMVMDMVKFARSKRKHMEAAMIFTCFVTSTRKGVLNRMKVSDLDFTNSKIRLEKCKGDLDHIVPMAREDMAVIKEYVDNHRERPANGYSDYLFLLKNGHKVYDDRINKILNYCARGIGLKQRAHPHALRRARILDLRKQGFTWEEIMQVTGHRNLSSLMAYIDEEDFDKVHKKLNDNSSPEPEPTPAKPTMSDIDKQLELVRLQLQIEEKKAENLAMQETNLKAQLELNPEHKSADERQTGYC